MKRVSEKEYNRIHLWLKEHYGSASKCTNKKCPKKINRFQWALKKNREYRRDVNCFIQLCASCHTKYDSKWNNRGKVKLQTIQIRLYPSTHKRLKVKAAKLGINLALLIQELSLK